MESTPGKIVLFGSGETSPSGRLVHERMFAQLKPPVRVAILETPAGFQPNSQLVAEELAEFVRSRLPNFSPRVSVVPARAKGPPYSTDDPALLAPMLDANYIFFGPGSPTYTVRQMKDSLAWCYVIGRHRLGATICLASAAAIAVGAVALPVYEIFKAGHDLHWVDGLDLFGPFGLEMAIVTHWDNREGGAKLDTSRCFMGQARWEKLQAMLPPTTVVVGVDEHTGLVLDFQAGGQASVMGRGGVTVISSGSTSIYPSGSAFPMDRIGALHAPDPVETCGPLVESVPAGRGAELPAEVVDLVGRREEARRRKSWAEADSLRQRLERLGYRVEDTRQGPRLRYEGSSTR